MHRDTQKKANRLSCLDSKHQCYSGSTIEVTGEDDADRAFPRKRTPSLSKVGAQ